MDDYSTNTNEKSGGTITNCSNNSILHRALSTVSANEKLVNNQRNVLAKNYRRTPINDEIVTIDHNDADASFILPNLYDLSEDIRIHLMNNLIDIPTMTSLEKTKRLNWWANKRLSCSKLYSLITSGDGNCLLHATSLAMWGFHDHALSMRKALNETLITSKPNSSLYRRWRWAQSVQNKKYDLIFSEEEWENEWKTILRLSSIEPRISQEKLSDSNIRQYYESLEEFHVYVLANNIRRPIIIYSDTILRTNNGEAISPIEFGGIYLPLEIPPDKCYKQPVFLAFDNSHFSALVPMEGNNQLISNVNLRIPLIDIDTLDLLPIHFFIDPGIDFQWPINKELSNDNINLYSNSEDIQMNILEKYLNLSKEYFSLNNFLSQFQSIHNNQILSIDKNFSKQLNSRILNKKLSRSSLNSFSKILRRTFFQPFSSTKRLSFKHQYHHYYHHNIPQYKNSSILFNHHSNILTIFLTNFQLKQSKLSNYMIKNYLETFINEYNPEKNSKQTYNENNILFSNYRHHTSSMIDSPIPLDSLNTTITLTRYIPKNDDIEIDNKQFLTSTSSIQQESDKLIQNNNLESHS